jgi:hypothetical protein
LSPSDQSAPTKAADAQQLERIWLQHRDGYAGGHLLATLDDGRKRVQLDQMQAPLVVDADMVHRANERAHDRVDDVVKLTFVNETSLLHLLRQR